MGVRMTLQVVVVLGLFLASSAGVAAEEQKHDWARHGYYVGLGTAYALEDFDLTDRAGPDTDADGSWGFDARLGYRWTYIAGEAQFQYYDEFTLEAGGDTAATRDGQSFSVNIKPYLSKCRFQPYLLAGLGFLRLASDVKGKGATRDAGTILIAESGRTATEFTGRFGAGLDAYITPNVLVYLEGTYLLAKSSLHDSRIAPIAFGLQYRFD